MILRFLLLISLTIKSRGDASAQSDSMKLEKAENDHEDGDPRVREKRANLNAGCSQPGIIDGRRCTTDSDCCKALCFQSYCTTSAARMVAQYAPYVWFASDEKFFPNTFEYVLTHMGGYSCPQAPGQPNPPPTFTPNVLQMFQSHNPLLNRTGCQIVTNPYKTGPDDTLPWYAGQNEQQWPMYYNAHKVLEGVWDVQFRFFYSYNLGKYQCVSAGVNGACLGTRVWFDNHILDEEHITIRFIGGTPSYVEYNWHQWGKSIAWEDIPEKFGGTHPVAYVASGSHGMWWSPGTHVYKKINLGKLVNMDNIQDQTGKGKAWQSWKSLVELDLTEPWFQYPKLQWGQGPFGDNTCQSTLSHSKTFMVAMCVLCPTGLGVGIPCWACAASLGVAAAGPKFCAAVGIPQDIREMDSGGAVDTRRFSGGLDSQYIPLTARDRVVKYWLPFPGTGGCNANYRNAVAASKAKLVGGSHMTCGQGYRQVSITPTAVQCTASGCNGGYPVSNAFNHEGRQRTFVACPKDKPFDPLVILICERPQDYFDPLQLYVLIVRSTQHVLTKSSNNHGSTCTQSTYTLDPSKLFRLVPTVQQPSSAYRRIMSVTPSGTGFMQANGVGQRVTFESEDSSHPGHNWLFFFVRYFKGLAYYRFYTINKQLLDVDAQGVFHTSTTSAVEIAISTSLFDESKAYVLRFKHSGSVFDASTPAANSAVYQWSYDQTKLWQKWHILPTGGPFFTLKNKDTGYCLTVKSVDSEGRSSRGSTTVEMPCTCTKRGITCDMAPQMFKFVWKGNSDGSGFWTMQCKAFGAQVMGVDGGSKQDGANIVMLDPNNSDSQLIDIDTDENLKGYDDDDGCDLRDNICTSA